MMIGARETCACHSANDRGDLVSGSLAAPSRIPGLLHSIEVRNSVKSPEDDQSLIGYPHCREQDILLFYQYETIEAVPLSSSHRTYDDGGGAWVACIKGSQWLSRCHFILHLCADDLW